MNGQEDAACTAKIRPLPNATELRCERHRLRHNQHGGIQRPTLTLPPALTVTGWGPVLRDYAYPGSETVIVWLESDRRNFRGEWAPCPWAAGCVLPAQHTGEHAT